MTDKELIAWIRGESEFSETFYMGHVRKENLAAAADRIEELIRIPIPAEPIHYWEQLSDLSVRVEILEREAVRISPSGSPEWYKFGSQQEFANWIRSLPSKE